MLVSFLFLCFLLIQPSFADDFGEYRYSKYLGIQQQLQNQRNNALRRQRMYNQVPTRRIQYPTAGNPYPNINRNRQYNYIPPRQRYSSQYYNRYYR